MPVGSRPSAVTTSHGVRHLRVAYLAWMMQGLWELGYADQAQQRQAELLALAQQLGLLPIGALDFSC